MTTQTLWKAQRDIRHWSNDGPLTDDSPKAWAVYGDSRICTIESSIGIAWDKDTDAEAYARLIANAVNDRAELRAMLERLIEWDAFMGGHEDTRWMMARDLYARTGNQLHTVARPDDPMRDHQERIDFAAAQERQADIVALVFNQYDSDDVETDDDVKVSEGDDNGAFVQAWVWVDFSGTPLDKKSEQATT